MMDKFLFLISMDAEVIVYVKLCWFSLENSCIETWLDYLCNWLLFENDSLCSKKINIFIHRM